MRIWLNIRYNAAWDWTVGAQTGIMQPRCGENLVVTEF